MKRLLIYFFYDKHGVVDRYVRHTLASVRPFCDEMLVVSNGEVNSDGHQLFSQIANNVIIRKNTGFDVWAYKTALDSYGWNKLNEYEEIVLMNYTIMGPVYDLQPMFEQMDKRKALDFWGITKCFEERSPEAQKLWNCPYGYAPEHIQSSFTAFRRSIFSSEIFRNIWDNMPMITSYYESGGCYEQYITKYYADKGFRWDCYTNYDDLDPKFFGCCPLITMPLEIVGRKKSPFFKRRSFFTSRLEFPSPLPNCTEFVEYLKTDTTFDVELLYENLVRTVNQRDLINTLSLYFFV